MSFKPSREERNWAQQLENDLKKVIQDAVSRKVDQDIDAPKKCPVDGLVLNHIKMESPKLHFSKCELCDGIWIDRVDLEHLLQSHDARDNFKRFVAKALDINISGTR